MDYIEAYKFTILVSGIVGFVFLFQLIVADVVALLRKHIPGHPIVADHSDFLFRSVRVHANTNESIGVYILIMLFGILSSASPYWLSVFSLVYLIGRIAHMLFYYGNLKLLRSASFVLSLVGLCGMLVISFMQWF